MTCAQARRLLGAYRRDDWSPAELAALGQHLRTCAECRQREASYRRVGESIRQLPSITPPPAFRESVFAAIRAEQRRLKPSIERIANEETSPSIPVIRSAPITRLPQRRRLTGGVRAALAIAAVLALALAATQVLSLTGLNSLVAGNLGAAHPLGSQSSANVTVARYTPDAHYQQVTAALASGGWLVYTAIDASGGAMLFAQNRHERGARPLLNAPERARITLHALTGNWAIWSAGDRGAVWDLYASKLSNGTNAAPVALAAANEGAGAVLTDVWAHGNTVLVASVSPSVPGEMAVFDLAAAHPVGRVLARASAAGHLMADLSEDGGVYYWADVWKDGSNRWHSRPWRGDASGQNDVPLLDDDRAFDPRAASGTLAWVEVPAAATGAASGADLMHSQQAIGSLSGAVVARDLISGRQWQIGPQAQAGSLRAHGHMLLWRSGSQIHTYDLRLGRPSSVEPQVRSSDWAELSDDAITWGGKSSPIYVYDV
jgi:hypothetical protein